MLSAFFAFLAVFAILVFVSTVISHAESEVPEVHVEQIRQEVEFGFKKVDQNGDPVKGAKFAASYTKVELDPATDQLFEKNYKIAEWVTDGTENQKVTFDIPYDEYDEIRFPIYIDEVDVPKGYAAAFNGYWYRINYTHDVQEPDAIVEKFGLTNMVTGEKMTLENPIMITDRKAPLLVNKIDDDGNFVKGAELALYDENDELVTSWTTSGKQDEIEIKRSAYFDETMEMSGGAKYTLKEIKTPEGYEKAEDIEFIIYPDGTWEYVNDQEAGSGDGTPGGSTDPSGTGSAPVPEPDHPIVPEPCHPQVPEPTPVVLDPFADRGIDEPIIMVDIKKPEQEKQEETGDFVINKVDQDGNPLEDVEFEVYAKPVMTYDTTTEVEIEKVWKYEGASTITHTIGPDYHALATYGIDTGDKYKFPYDFMANLKAKVEIVRNGKILETFEGHDTVSNLLGDSLTHSTTEELITEVPKFEVGNPKVATDGLPHWQFEGTASETLGKITLKPGEKVTVKDSFTGSLAGEFVYVSGQTVTISGTVNEDGIGHYYNFVNGIYNTSPYIALDHDHLIFFKEKQCGDTGGNLVRNIAAKPVTIENRDGDIIVTDENGIEYDITGEKILNVVNLIQWRSQDGPDSKCPPKWK